jgi:hypothetical protein
VGIAVGRLLGAADGAAVGPAVGAAEGVAVGPADGAAVGLEVRFTMLNGRAPVEATLS